MSLRCQGPAAAAILGAGALFLAIAFQGCVSQSKARADAEAAFRAGQHQAFSTLGQTENQLRPITINGDVKTPLLPWTPDLTLARAIVLAEFRGITGPEEIFIVRQGGAIRCTAEQLLKGEDVMLQPGDVIQLGRR